VPALDLLQVPACLTGNSINLDVVHWLILPLPCRIIRTSRVNGFGRNLPLFRFRSRLSSLSPLLARRYGPALDRAVVLLPRTWSTPDLRRQSADERSQCRRSKHPRMGRSASDTCADDRLRARSKVAVRGRLLWASSTWSVLNMLMFR
jgi:hypothetical protein